MNKIEKFCEEVEKRGLQRLKEAVLRNERSVTEEMYRRNLEFLSKVEVGAPLYIGWFDACDFKEYRTIETLKIATPVVEQGAFLGIQFNHIVFFRSRADGKLKSGTSIELSSVYEVGLWPFPFVVSEIKLGPKTNPHTSKKFHRRKMKGR